MKRRALLIGSQTRGLKGVHGDVDRMAKALQAWQFDVRRCIEQNATRDGILAAYRALIADTEPGDAALVYYSGHGAFTDNPDAVAGIAGEYHQFLIATDFDEVTPESGKFRGVTNVELSDLQSQLTDKTRNVTVVLDCCHSAWMARPLPLRARTVKATEWTNTVSAFVRALQASNQAPAARYTTGNPHAVRISACEQDQTAWENDTGGLLTGSLVRALHAASHTPSITWRQIMNRVRDEVLSRMSSQRPDVTGPDDRKLFTTDTATLTGMLLLGTKFGEPILRGGSLMGVETGDTYLVMKHGEAEADEARAAARATVGYVESTTSFVTLDYLNGHTGLPDGACGFPERKHLRRSAIALQADGELADPIRRAIEQSGHLRVLKANGDEADQAPALATIALEAGQLTVRNGLGQVWLAPIPASGDTASKLVHNVTLLARAESLRRLTSGTGHARLDTPFGVEWGRVRDREPTSLAMTDAVLREGDKLYVKVTNAGHARIYVSVFDIGLAGAIERITRSGSTGLAIEPGEFQGVGVHPYLGVVGLGPVTWPDAAARIPGEWRRESLIIIATDQPHDLSVLQGVGAEKNLASQGSDLARAMAWIYTGGTRDLRGEVDVEHVRYAVKRIDFWLEPDAAT